jgi:two-component sensor histidine kinase
MPSFAPVSLMIPGGPEAARHARHAVLQRVGGHIDAASADVLSIVISELVTDSLRHADVGPGRYLHISVGIVDDRLWVTVSDRGARTQPRLAAADRDGTGLGQQLVDRLARSWGVARDGSGRTQLWCELPFSDSGRDPHPAVSSPPIAPARD